MRRCAVNAAELIAELAKYPPDTPVVMAMTDEPWGDYGVLAVTESTMARDRPGADWIEVWGEPKEPCSCPIHRDQPNTSDPGQLVALLGYDRPPRRIVDVELPDPEPKAITR